MAIEEIVEFVKAKAAAFGAKPPDATRPSYVFRENLNPPFGANQAYFGIVQPDEGPSGAYHDFSFAIMPAEEEGKPWLVNLCVGSLGFKNDYDLATYPGLRRQYQQLVDADGFCKSDFSDIETPLSDTFRDRDDLSHMSEALDKYSRVFCAGQIIRDPYSHQGQQVISAFLAVYAGMRKWQTNNAHRQAVENALNSFVPAPSNYREEVLALLKQRRFVVLEGAPGTGKTRLAKLLGDDLNAKVFFTQFHAETTYSDFVWGIRPQLGGEQVGYAPYVGELTQAIVFAQEHPDSRVLLIIDEINRANLSNVLGPVFYLFEPRMDEIGETQIAITPDLSVSSIPDNLFVVATMNSADRSLAVVDFALRRRFAWYRLDPQAILDDDDFHADDFKAIGRIFQMHANTQELSLQPGQAYFLAGNADEMRDRIRFELLPLIREYVQEGYLRTAREDLNKFFLDKIQQPLFD